MHEAFFWIIIYLHVLFKGTPLSDASALATAQICASPMLLQHAVGDEKETALIGFVE